MAEATLPEDIILLILAWLPVKALIRFTCVSKHFHSLILSDPKFAKSQFQAARGRKTITHRLLYSVAGPQIKSLDLETPSFGELKFPFEPPADNVSLLGSCNGIVFLAFDGRVYYVWNPSTGFIQELPDPGFSQNGSRVVICGVGYLPATDDYKVFVVSQVHKPSEGIHRIAAIFSYRAHAWKTLDVDTFCIRPYQPGTLLKEALHWVGDENEIVAFDLAEEELRKMLQPNFHEEGEWWLHTSHLGVSGGGCLSLTRYRMSKPECIDVWVMRDYDVRESWTKLFSFMFIDRPLRPKNYLSVVVLETSIVVQTGDKSGVVKIVHQKEEGEEEDKWSMCEVKGKWIYMTQYQESLLRIDD